MKLNNRWVVLAILSSALLLITVDMTVLYTALPRLTRELNATASEKLWIVNAYPLVVAGLLPGLGTLGDRLGHQRLFVWGLVVFGFASLAAAFAPDPAVLIGARVFLAVGAAMMMPATLSLIRLTFEDESERAFAIGIWAAVASGGAALGPVLGGFLLEHFWWGSVFLINVPIVALALILALLFIPKLPGHAARPWDLVGSIQILVGLVALAYAVKELARRDATWASVLIALLVGVAAFAVFVRRQNRARHKLIDFTLFRNARFSSGVAVAIVAALSLIGFELVLTQRFQLVLGLSPLEAGLALLPIPLAAFLAGPLAGLLVPRLGAMSVLWTALLLAASGPFVALLFPGAPGEAPQILGFVLMGAGLGGAMTAASGIIMSSAPADRAGMAASIEEVSYELGGAIGVAVLGSVMTAVYGLSLALPDGLAVSPAVFDSLDEALIAAEALPADLGATLRDTARLAFDRAFVAVGTITVVLMTATAIAVRLFGRRSDGPASDAAARPARPFTH